MGLNSLDEEVSWEDDMAQKVIDATKLECLSFPVSLDTLCKLTNMRTGKNVVPAMDVEPMKKLIGALETLGYTMTQQKNFDWLIEKNK